MPTPVPTVHRAVAAAVVASTVLALAACGSADEPTTAAGTEPAPAISIDAGLAVDPGDGDGPAPAPSPSLSPECLELQEMWAETNRALAGIDEAHPRLLVTGFREADRAFSSVETPDVAGFDGMAEYLDSAASALADVDPDDADAVASVLTLTFSEADTARAAAAHGQVTAYLDGGCRG